MRSQVPGCGCTVLRSCANVGANVGRAEASRLEARIAKSAIEPRNGKAQAMFAFVLFWRAPAVV